MSDSRDLPLLSSKSSLVEDAQQRYIDALERRITSLEKQEHAQSTGSKDNVPKETTTDVKPSGETKGSDSKASEDKAKDKDSSSENKSETDNARPLKDLPSIQAYSMFFEKIKIVARRYSKTGEDRQEKPVGEEEVICDVPDTAAGQASTNGDPVETNGVKEDASTKKTSVAPIIFTLSINEDDFVSKATARINDPELQALLQIFFAHYPTFGPDLVGFSVSSPFEPFVQHWWDLKALLKGDTDHAAVKQFNARVDHFKKMRQEPIGWPPRLGQFLRAKDGVALARPHLEILMSLVYETIRGRAGEHGLFRILQEDPALGQDEVPVSFETLWTVFKPGDIVVSRPFLDEPQAFIVHESMESGIKRDEKPVHWKLICWSYDWTGKTFRRFPVELRVEYFRGTRRLDLLSVIPLKLVEKDKVDKLKQRGRHFYDICIRERGSRVFQYSGEAILRASGIGRVNLTRASDNMEGDSNWSASDFFRKILMEILGGDDFTNTTTVEIDGAEQVMIDALSFRQHGPGKHYQRPQQMPMGKVRFSSIEECRCAICQQNDYLAESQKTSYDMDAEDVEKGFKEETQYMICPPRVLGYHLSSKRWVELNVDRVQEAERIIDTSAFESLRMESGKSKALLKNLVTSHWKKKRSDNKGKMRDLMKGKGESLVILLYGPPGVGKTLTAESVAKASGKPLLSVTVADIGLDPEKVEQNLGHVFRLAASWEAIILFDEADVFLESRSSETASLQRNSLVSELLRVLEYYDGMLILTTNRLRRFDHAVMSRINLAVRYPDLNHEQKKQIFMHFVRQLDEDATADLARIERWIREEDTREELEGLNGRQIRNILFSAARMTSEQEGGKLSLEAITQLTQATKRFVTEIRADLDASRQKNEPGYHM
ncbi:ATPase family associated with various cellular activities (AAA) domain-containing protein [Sarocladium implicatum]|nr:ATPase family associated with various cellular activities (AAA) domain-containing protein [Sarocladium implicatum]